METDAFWGIVPSPESVTTTIPNECSDCGGTGWIRYIQEIRGWEIACQRRIPVGVTDMEASRKYPGSNIALEPCACQTIGWRQQRVQQMTQSSGFPLDALLYDLRDFQKYKTAYRYAVQMVEGAVSDGTVERPGLLLMGPTGTGKTTLASIIYHKRMEAGHSGAWINYIELQDRVRATYDPSYDGPGKANIIEALIETAFLALDDLGSPTRADRQYAEDMIDIVYHVMDNRYNQHKATLITTNLDIDTLVAQFGMRVVSRLRGLCHGVTMRGMDYRTGEAQ